ncbi:hypothetical protein [Steroidobacter cummioxidans]|uniref:hypothetical protein n=1 Tax=Steroidobacter cummioxidans TaxID=1803913 RepID=UPI000E310978|nr:hypothetical protein [Steroidobacter cummioxidans]
MANNRLEFALARQTRTGEAPLLAIPRDVRGRTRMSNGVGNQSMRTSLMIAIAAAVSAMAPGFAFGAEKTPTAFVGSFVKIVSIECESGDATDAETGEAVVVLCMDALYQATYRVERVLEGKLVTDSEVTFNVADHYGFPKFAERKRALIFLDEHDGNYYHIKYQWVPAFRTSEGDFAQCGCEAEDENEDLQKAPESSPDCRLLSFSPAVTRDLTHSSQYVIDKLRTDLDYKIRGDRAECVRGILVEDVYKRLRPELMENINAR